VTIITNLGYGVHGWRLLCKRKGMSLDAHFYCFFESWVYNFVCEMFSRIILLKAWSVSMSIFVQLNWRRQDMECKIKDINIYYEIRGEGRPIIIIHGLGENHLFMTSLFEPIFERRGGWKRIYLDLPGMGNTKAPEWISNSGQMLEIVLDFIEAVIPEQPFSLAGYSYGAYLARGIVFRNVNLVDGLLLMCPVIIAEHSKRNLPPQKALIKDIEFISSLEADQQELFDSFAVIQNQQMWEKCQIGIDSEKLADSAFIEKLQADNAYPLSFDPDKIPTMLERPTLILAGRQDGIVGYRDAWQILENYPRATFAVLDLAGHALPIEQEHLFIALVDEWLSRVEERNYL
jgi:pimeloyl-ACP methyl ester carboxylesterase